MCISHLLQVLSATNHMSVKTESNVAASLALVKLITQQLSDQLLEEVTYVSPFPPSLPPSPSLLFPSILPLSLKLGKFKGNLDVNLLLCSILHMHIHIDHLLVQFSIPPSLPLCSPFPRCSVRASLFH